MKGIRRELSAALLGFGFALLVAGGAAAQEPSFSNSDCLECHAQKDLTGTDRRGHKISVYVDNEVFRHSVHGNFKCVKCHSDIRDLPHREKLKPVNCGKCHRNAQADYARSTHGKAYLSGDPDAPSCSSCHGVHDILPVEHPNSQVSRTNLIRTCVSCHTDEQIVKRHKEMPGTATIKAYEKSVHGRGFFEEGLVVSAQCTDCHSYHLILPATDPQSKLYKTKVPETCGKCHREIERQYNESVHGQAIAKGILDAPVCTDCHGEHNILPPTESGSKVSAKNIPKTCSACHDNVALAEKYQLPINRYKTYLESFHGVALKYGETVVANCASCHGVHNILPSTDPRSTIYPGNRQKTCGKCHPGIGLKAAMGKVHVEAKPTSSKGKYIVRTFYTWFIGILMVLFILYIIVEIIGKLRQRKARGTE